MKIIIVLFGVLLMLVGCSPKGNLLEEESTQKEMEDVYEESSFEQETAESENSVSNFTGKSKEEYIQEIGVTKENSRIVMYYQYDNYIQYKVYEFDDTEYRLSYYDFYDDEESFLTPYNFLQKYGSNNINDYFDSSCYLHYYQEPLKKGNKEEAYAGVMYSIEMQMGNSNNDFVHLVEEN